MENQLLGHFLPSGLLAHFSIISFSELCFTKDKSVYLSITLEENNKLLGVENEHLYESKGFTEITLQDFPIRGKAVYLVIRRRRWRQKLNHSITHRNDFSFVAEGSVFTKELSDFLKDRS